MLRLQVIGPHSVRQGAQVAAACSCGRDQPLHDWPEECTRATGRLNHRDGAKIDVGPVAGQVEEGVHHPAASEDLAVVHRRQGHTRNPNPQHRHFGASHEPADVAGLARRHMDNGTERVMSGFPS